MAAELEARWEAALAALKQAEAAQAQPTGALPALPADLQAAFSNIGQHLPQVWQGELLTRAQKKAL